MIHRIRKQLMDLTFDSSLDGFHLQHEISQQYWNEVVPIMDSVFEKMDVKNSVIEIDKLEIDLGTIMVSSVNQHTWLKDLPLLIEKSMRDLLTEQNFNHKIPIPQKIKIFHQWLFYMQHGYLSWNAEPVTDEWLITVIKALSENSDNIQLLRRLLINNSTMARRIVSQNTPSFVFTLLRLLIETSQDLLVLVIDELFLVYQHVRQTMSVKYPLNHKAFTQYCLTELLQNAKSNESPEKLMSHLVNIFFKTYNYAKNLPYELTEQLEETLSMIQNKQESISNIEDKFEKPEEQDKEKTEEDRLDENGIFIENAGIVLLHPFIPTLFRRLNFIHDVDFSDRMAQVQAMMLLHFLATGNKEMREYEITIAKMLCNYPLEDPLDLETELMEEQLEEADAMLMATIQQWEKIQNTSLTALRESFLQRPGKLYNQNDKLYLHVETQSIDLLLDYLPWNLSIIKLPWMNRALHVNWR